MIRKRHKQDSCVDNHRLSVKSTLKLTTTEKPNIQLRYLKVIIPHTDKTPYTGKKNSPVSFEFVFRVSGDTIVTQHMNPLKKDWQ